MLLKEKEVKDYNSETSSGIYSIDVKIGVRTRVRYGKIKTGYLKPPEKIVCKLKVPLRNSDNKTLLASDFDFKASKCSNVYILTGPPD